MLGPTPLLLFVFVCFSSQQTYFLDDPFIELLFLNELMLIKRVHQKRVIFVTIGIF